MASRSGITQQPDRSQSSQQQAPAFSLSGVTKSFGRTAALREIDLELGWGSCLALLGHNGAGKSTLLRVLATLVRPDSGSVQVAGHDRGKHQDRVRATVGYLGHQTLLYDELTPLENLRFYARLYNVPKAQQRITQLLQDVGVEEWAERRVATLSNGIQKRVAMARALIHQPSLLLLDEPETGLDQRGRELLGTILTAVVKAGASVVMTTHSLETGLEAADRVAVLVQGRLALQAPRHQVDSAILQRLLAGGERGTGERR